jgi:hypothetical protein
MFYRKGGEMKNNFFKITDSLLILLLMLVSGCKKKQPDTPEIPTGPSVGYINQNYIFSSSATDPNGDNIAIRFDWGDNDTSEWSLFVSSGDSVSMSHFWTTSDTYYIKTQAKNIAGANSNWSNSHQIKIIVRPGWTYGGSLGDEGKSVQQTLDGGYIIAGYTESFGAGGYDVYLIKTDGNGNTAWTKTYGGSYEDKSNSVQQTSDGGFITVGNTVSFGAGGSDVYLIKTDVNGDTTWTKTYGGSNYDKGNSVQQTSDGGYIITGSTSSFGPIGQNIYLIKTDVNGDSTWTKTYYGGGVGVGNSVQQTSDGGYIIIANVNDGVYLIKTGTNGDTVWTKIYSRSNYDIGNSVQQTLDGGYIIAGYTYLYGPGGFEVYLIKTNVNGDTVWTRTFGGNRSDISYSVQQTSDGGFIIAGLTGSFGAGSFDAYLIKTDANGDSVWTKTFGGSNYDESTSVQQTSDGGYIITGSTKSFGSGDFDVYLIKTDENGNTL